MIRADRKHYVGDLIPVPKMSVATPVRTRAQLLQQDVLMDQTPSRIVLPHREPTPLQAELASIKKLYSPAHVPAAAAAARSSAAAASVSSLLLSPPRVAASTPATALPKSLASVGKSPLSVVLASLRQSATPLPAPATSGQPSVTVGGACDVC